MGRVIRGSRKGKSLIFAAKTRLRKGAAELMVRYVCLCVVHVSIWYVIRSHGDLFVCLLVNPHVMYYFFDLPLP